MDSFEALARVVWKNPYYEKEWKGFKYGLELIQISKTDQIKLREIILRASVRKSNFWEQMGEQDSEAMKLEQSNLAA